ncbi:LuxR C-terminal-related transcriptional regulator [Nonomuraea lactucae]|uniref:LuxR C-terminal-related transcriptional regulator n=1 Tax=Nonomuraea lactucae TaxID=2249762 RepID=UPI001963C2DC|nr:LuxR C-terminal-related transcriptional regulator [Nonomuraea lactucae]
MVSSDMYVKGPVTMPASKPRRTSDHPATNAVKVWPLSTDDGYDVPPMMLSEREREVLEYLAEGYTYVSIGHRMNISPHTVDTYLRRIRKKTGAVHRSQLTVIAMALGRSDVDASRRSCGPSAPPHGERVGDERVTGATATPERSATTDRQATVERLTRLWGDTAVRTALAAWDFGRVSALMRERVPLSRDEMCALTGLRRERLTALEAGRRGLTDTEQISRFLTGLRFPWNFVPMPLAAHPCPADGCTRRLTHGTCHGIS